MSGRIEAICSGQIQLQMGPTPFIESDSLSLNCKLIRVFSFIFAALLIINGICLFVCLSYRLVSAFIYSQPPKCLEFPTNSLCLLADYVLGKCGRTASMPTYNENHVSSRIDCMSVCADDSTARSRRMFAFHNVIANDDD